MLNPGDMFEGKYVIRERLGAGGFAIVYRAHQANMKRDVAIKLVHPAKTLGLHPEKLFQRFNREAQLLAELQNEQNVRIFDFGHSDEHSALYMVMEYIDGTPLDKLLKRSGPMEPARVVAILEQVLLALAEAHKLKILHRDVKPGNIIVFERFGDKDRAKLIDYGIAKPMKPEVEGEGITAEGSVVGTPRYMAPEQIILVSALSPATDIYSLGLVAYEMLVGKSLLAETQQTEVLKRQLSAEVFNVPNTIPAPEELRHVINTMLRKPVRDRYQSCEEVINALRRIDVRGVPAASISASLPVAVPNTAETRFDRPETGETISSTELLPHPQHQSNPQWQTPQQQQQYAQRGPDPYQQQHGQNPSGPVYPPHGHDPSGQHAYNQNPSGSMFPPSPNYPPQGAPYPQQYPQQQPYPQQQQYGQYPQHPQQPHPQQYPPQQYQQNPSGQMPGHNPSGSLIGAGSTLSDLITAPSKERKTGTYIGIAVAVGAVFFLMVAAGPRNFLKKAVGMAACVEDNYEPNQRSLDGTLMTRGARLRATACPGNVDWYFIGNRNVGDVISVAAEYEEGESNISVELWVDSRFIERATHSRQGGIVSHRLRERGAVAIRVTTIDTNQMSGRDYVIVLEADQRNAPAL